MDNFQLKIMENAIHTNAVTNNQLHIFCKYYEEELIKNNYDLNLIHIRLLNIAKQQEKYTNRYIDSYIRWVSLYKNTYKVMDNNG